MESDIVQRLNFLSIYFYGHLYICNLKYRHIIMHMRLFTNCELYYHGIYSYLFLLNNSVGLLKAKESKACIWRLNWEGGETLRQNPSRKKTQVQTLKTESRNQNLLTCAVKSRWHWLLGYRARPSVRGGAKHLLSARHSQQSKMNLYTSQTAKEPTS